MCKNFEAFVNSNRGCIASTALAGLFKKLPNQKIHVSNIIQRKNLFSHAGAKDITLFLSVYSYFGRVKLYEGFAFYARKSFPLHTALQEDRCHFMHSLSKFPPSVNKKKRKVQRWWWIDASYLLCTELDPNPLFY